MKRIFSQKQWNWIKRNVRPENGIMPSLMVAFLMIATLGHKQEIQAYRGYRGGYGYRGYGHGYGYGPGYYGREYYNGKGAAIGAGVLGIGALMGAAASSSERSSNDPFNRLNKLKRKRTKLEDKIASTSSDRRRAKYERQLEATQNQIDRMEKNLGIRQQPAVDSYQQPVRAGYQQPASNDYNEYK